MLKFGDSNQVWEEEKGRDEEAAVATPVARHSVGTDEFYLKKIERAWLGNWSSGQVGELDLLNPDCHFKWDIFKTR